MELVQRRDDQGSLRRLKLGLCPLCGVWLVCLGKPALPARACANTLQANRSPASCEESHRAAALRPPAVPAHPGLLMYDVLGEPGRAGVQSRDPNHYYCTTLQ